MQTADMVRSAFPELEAIDDDELRERVVDIWVDAMIENGYDDVHAITWWPPLESELDGDGVTTVEHVRDVTRITISLLDAVETDLDRDLAIAGALLHDCSKLYEIDDGEMNETSELVPHPHFAVHLLARAGCSDALQNVVLAHSRGSAVEPKTLEARIVQQADELAVDSLFWERNGELRP